MKLNLGCGFKKKEGFVNVDKFEACSPDQVVDLETTPWPFDTSAVDEVVFDHSLEHMGASSDKFLSIMKELYRVCKPGARIEINVPHPRHDDFMDDPTHVRAITPRMLRLFDKKLNEHWRDTGDARTLFALYLDVNFAIKTCIIGADPRYQALLNNRQINEQQLVELSLDRNNVIKAYQIILEVIK